MSDARQHGFTLLELIVSMAVLAVLATAMLPLATATVRAEKIDQVQRELNALAAAAEEYYFANGAFPTAVNQVGFYGSYLVAGVQDDAITDAWGGSTYRTVQVSSPDTVTFYSVGENGVDDGVNAEAFKITVQGSKPGGERTRLRMRVIAAAVAEHVAGGGTVTGTWTTDHAALGLAASYLRDGFGTEFRLNTSLELRSAGADRSFSTADDIVF
ncbi:MAG: type II secretion system protein [Planctomycetes bacterium]|nr:type II secretion system protein [Planctomycetota bacterium]MCB9869864.1 type II secretion system protein [Planctomycetota bacterium]MCB9889094.1 type II secretion system protein [Planctomycetota bacterium]